MVTNGGITAWHYDDTNECYIISTYNKVWYNSSDKTSTTKNGITKSPICIIRIPTSDAINLQIGDYIRLGLHTDVGPDRGNDFKVCELSDNRYGSQPHWRAACE